MANAARIVGTAAALALLALPASAQTVSGVGVPSFSAVGPVPPRSGQLAPGIIDDLNQGGLYGSGLTVDLTGRGAGGTAPRMINRHCHGRHCHSHANNGSHFHAGNAPLVQPNYNPPATQELKVIKPGPHLAQQHQAWCSSHYNSYDPSTNTFQPYDAPRRACNSPFN